MKAAPVLLLLLLSAACTTSTTPTTGPHATVEMRDGSSVSGMVLSSTADEVKITADDNVTRTIPMAQVRAIDYGDAPAAGAAAPATGGAPTMTKAAPPARRAVSRPALPRPTADDITSET